MSLGAEDDGYALTVPLECPGKRLQINARNGREGFVKVAVRRGDGVADGNWLTSYGYDRMVAFTGDSTQECRATNGSDAAGRTGAMFLVRLSLMDRGSKGWRQLL